MSTDIPIYRARLREAQNLFRNNEKVRAYEFAQALLAEFPDAPDIRRFFEAVARANLATAWTLARDEDHEMAIYYARSVVKNEIQRVSALRVILEAARAGYDSQSRASLLHSICHDDPTNTLYWGEIALCIKSLPANEESIEIAFEALSVLPGHDEALQGLSHLISSYETTTAAAPSADGAL